MESIPMTREGYEALKRELERLKKEERPKIIAEIERARAFGDLSENAEYHAAKEKQAFIETKIRELESKLARAVIVEQSPEEGRVVFGCKVKLEDLDTGQIVEYHLVGGDEADPPRGKISIHSPVARALVGKEEGDEVEVQVPAGKRRYLILEVRTS
ncbi:MAG: transcription elongation factor GreA [Deltaproteobacteria bacterium]|nr:MAG: transcription elongation factor GreA [Deltaproteobacteria bacterium]